jgi:uncharacterized protein YaiL (DUF2058 family)
MRDCRKTKDKAKQEQLLAENARFRADKSLRGVAQRTKAKLNREKEANMNRIEQTYRKNRRSAIRFLLEAVQINAAVADTGADVSLISSSIVMKLKQAGKTLHSEMLTAPLELEAEKRGGLIIKCYQHVTIKKKIPAYMMMQKTKAAGYGLCYAIFIFKR